MSPNGFQKPYSSKPKISGCVLRMSYLRADLVGGMVQAGLKTV